MKDAGKRLLSIWNKLKDLPGGRFLFDSILSWWVPYTGSIHAHVLEFEAGRVSVELVEHRAVRNHLGSIHAIALANLCEMTSGLAMLSALPAGMRGIVTGFSLEYLKKARGILVASSSAPSDLPSDDAEIRVQVQAKDETGDIVVRAEATWRVSKAK